MSYAERKKQPNHQGYLDYDDKRAIKRRIDFLIKKDLKDFYHHHI
jgi:hypothetical protein